MVKSLFMSISWQKYLLSSSACFGCTCFVQDLSPDLDKLSPRSIECAFIGYSRTQKGYQCYSPSTRKYFVSADVIFVESVLYFSPQGSITASESNSLSLSVSLPAPAVVHDVSSPVSLKDTTTPPAPKPHQKNNFRHVYTHRQKFLPLDRLRPPLLQWKVHLLSR